MKKLIVFAAALLVSATAFAEGFGIIGGYTSSSMKMQEMTFKSSAGVHAGFAYNVPLGIGFSLQPELIYNVKGYNWQGDKDAAALQEKAKFGYVEVPVQLQWGPDLLLLRPYVLAEPFVGFAVTGKKIAWSMASASVQVSKSTTACRCPSSIIGTSRMPSSGATSPTR